MHEMKADQRKYVKEELPRRVPDNCHEDGGLQWEDQTLKSFKS